MENKVARPTFKEQISNDGALAKVFLGAGT